MRGRLPVLLCAAVLCPACKRHAEESRDDQPSLDGASAETLVKLGATVIGTPGQEEVLVASYPVGMSDLVRLALGAKGIGDTCWAGGGLGAEGLYVGIDEFSTVQEALLELKRKRGLKRLWVWEPEGSQPDGWIGRGQ